MRWIALLACFICSTAFAQLTPEQEETIRQALNLPPGSTITLQHEATKTTDQGTLEVTEEASGKGAALRASGEKIVGDFNATAPQASLGENRTASGSDVADSMKITGSVNLWANPLMWVGILCILAAGACLYLGLPPKATLITAIAGAGFITAAIMPGVLIFLLAAVGLIVVGPYIYTEWKAIKNKTKLEEEAEGYREALRAAVAGISDLKTRNPDLYNAAKAAISSHTTDDDIAVIQQIKTMDRL